MKLPIEAAVFLMEQRTQLLGDVTRAYLESCKGDAHRIARHIPPDKTPAVCVDIGGGLGGVSAMLAELWPAAEFIILDRDGHEGRKVNFSNDEPFGKYNQLALTSQFLKSGRVRHKTCNIEAQSPPAKVDLAFSVLSWGFHYPVSAHIAWVAKATDQLIIDCRADTGAAVELAKHFAVIEPIHQAYKHEWYLCRK